MQQFKLTPLALATSLLLSACGGDDGSNGVNGTNGADGTNGSNGTNGTNGSNGFSSLVSQTPIQRGDDICRFGGVKIDSGLDSNSNNILDAAEITQSNHVCSSDDSFQLQLLHFADVDGGRDIINNAVRFSAILKEFKGQYENNLVLSSGDNWIPGPEYNVASDGELANVLGVTDTGRAHVAYLNALGVQASVFGNHEFDLGTGDIADLIASEVDGESTWVGASFPYLSANLDFSTDDNLADLVGTNGSSHIALKNKIAASTVVYVNGERVGVVGATTTTLNSISSPGEITILPSEGADNAALAAEIQKSVDELTAAGVNKIVLLAHMQQIAIERELATLLSDVDIIVAGGSNTILADGNDRLRDGDAAADEYPLSLNSASNEPVLIVNTDGDYTYLGRLLVNFTPDGIIIPELLNSNINGAYATDETGLIEHGLSTSDAIPEVAAISSALNNALVARAGNVFGHTSVYLNGVRGSVRTEETNLGNLTAKANLVYAQQTEANVAVSLKNGGGIRASIGTCSIPAGGTGGGDLECKAPAGIPGVNNPGEISQLDLEIALRFNNDLTLLTLTGAQLKEILEHSVAASGDGATPGRFPQVAGIRFSFDTTQTAQTVTPEKPYTVTSAGSRIRNLVVLDDNGAEEGGSSVVVVQDGELTDAAEQTFRIVTLGFLAGGGDSYPYPSGDAVNKVDLEKETSTGNVTFSVDGKEQDALAEYLFTNFPADEDEATPSFNQADTPAAEDNNIQNLSVVENDTIILK